MTKTKVWHWALILGVFVITYFMMARSAATGFAGG